MALYDAKIEKLCKKSEILEKSIRRDTEERKRILAEISRLRYLSLCEKMNCNGEELETVLAREHGQIQRLKSRGFSDEEIDALDENEGETTKNSEEDDNESEIF